MAHSTDDPSGPMRANVDALAATVNGEGEKKSNVQSPSPVVSFAAPQNVGRFVLLRLLGTGGMGSVYAAFDERLDRRVAIKLLHHIETAGSTQRLRVLREAQAMARVAHPNVVSIFEVGEIAVPRGLDQIFIAMEFVEGMTLSQWQRTGQRSWQDVLRMYLQAGRGLAAAHASGLIHRDFKADNVLVGQDGRPRVADFGLAQLGGDGQDVVPESPAGRSGEGLATSLTVTGAIAGTPGYMSPEQFCGSQLDARSDQFSFCAALYEALYGHLPFAGASLAELGANVLAGKILLPPPKSPIPREVHQALLRGLSTDPTRRFPSMSELLSTLGLEQAHSAAGAGDARRRFVRGVILPIILLNALDQYVRGTRSLSLRQVLVIDLVSLAIFLGIGFLVRKALQYNAFHRRLWLLCLVFLLQKVGILAIALYSHLPLVQYLALDILTIGTATAVMALLILPSMWWLPIFMIGVAALTIIYGAPILWLSLTTYSVTVGTIALAWQAAAGRAQQELLHRKERE